MLKEPKNFLEILLHSARRLNATIVEYTNVDVKIESQNDECKI